MVYLCLLLIFLLGMVEKMTATVVSVGLSTVNGRELCAELGENSWCKLWRP
jgi:hypothetical protein